MELKSLSPLHSLSVSAKQALLNQSACDALHNYGEYGYYTGKHYLRNNFLFNSLPAAIVQNGEHVLFMLKAYGEHVIGNHDWAVNRMSARTIAHSYSSTGDSACDFSSGIRSYLTGEEYTLQIREMHEVFQTVLFGHSLLKNIKQDDEEIINGRLVKN